jgi:hypothetical protein
MDFKRIGSYSVLILGVLLVLSSAGWGQSQVAMKRAGSPPVIVNAFAVDKGYYGYILKFYIEANDPDGDMLRIATVVDQVGYGHYPTDFIYLKGQNQKEFKGYIQWNTFSSRTNYIREWTQITVKVSVLDKAGNESHEVVFPFTFESGVKGQYDYKLPPPFEQKDLPKIGNVFIDLFEPTMMGNGNHRHD